jgi:hypothetical protein
MECYSTNWKASENDLRFFQFTLRWLKIYTDMTEKSVYDEYIENSHATISNFGLVKK